MEIRSLPVGPIGTNCYILCDETAQVCAVIDPGDEAPRVADAVKATGCVPCAILLTHGHYDHTGGVQALSALWPETPVYLSCRDQGGDNAPAQLFPPYPQRQRLRRGRRSFRGRADGGGPLHPWTLRGQRHPAL